MPRACALVAGVGVNRQEQVGAFAVRDRRALLERDEVVGRGA